MHFRVLGPMEVLHDGRPVAVGGRQRRTVLGVLLTLANEIVSADRLIDEVWGEGPPDAARKTIQAHIARLRAALNVDGEILRGESTGYVLAVGADDVDAGRFESLSQEGRALRASQPAAAVDRLTAALDEWRGRAYAGLADETSSLRAEAARLEELRLVTIEDRAEARLVTGDAGALVPELERLTTDEPLRERLWGLLMVALYRAGRQADALRTYQKVWRILGDELGIEPSPELQRLEAQILEHDAALEPLGATTATAVVPPAAVRNPYKGLRPFDEHDASDFHGRDDLVRRLVDRVEGKASDLVVIAGPSGSGKSSVVRAGLVPALRDQGERWDIVAMVPGPAPFTALGKALSELDERLAPGEVAAAARSHPERAARDLLSRPASQRVLLFIDQFEELFTLPSEDERDDFLDFIATVVTDPGLAASVVVTIRADLLHRPMSHPRMAGSLEGGLVLVPPLAEHEIRAAVTEPALGVGVEVEPELVAEIVAEVRRHPAALPLLQYALTDVFERRRGGGLTLDAYRAAGGISGALARRADDLYRGWDTEEQEMARQLFFRLVAVTEEGEHLRRRVRRADLEAGVGDSQALDRVLERLGEHRLIVFDQEPETGYSTVEVAHEALLREWPRLAKWLEAAQDDLVLHQRLAHAAAEWSEAGRDAGYLLTGSRLAQFASWAEETTLLLTPDEAAYLEASSKAAATEDRRRARRRRAITTVLAATAAVAIGFAVFALSQREEARRQADLAAEQAEIAAVEAARAEEQAALAATQAEVAEQQRELATVRELVAAAIANIDVDPELSTLLALEAVHRARAAGDGLGDAEQALHTALQAMRTELAVDGGGAAFFSPDGGRIISGGDADAWVWDATTGDLVLTLVGHQDAVFNAVYSSDGRLIATNGEDLTTRVWDAVTGEEMWVFASPGGDRPVGLAFSPDSELLAVGYQLTGQVLLIAAATGDEVAALPNEDPLGLNFSPDGSLLAVANSDVGLHLWDVAAGEIRLTVPAVDDRFADVEFSPDGSLLIAGGQVPRVFDAATGAEIERLFGHTSPAETVAFGPTGTTATGGLDGTVRIWDPDSGEEIVVLRGHGAGILNLAYSPDGDRVASGGVDGTLRIWDVTPGGRREIVTIAGHPFATDVSLSTDGTMLASGGFDGMARIWDAVSGELLLELEGHQGPLRRVEFNWDGSVVGTSSFDGTVRVWDTASGEELFVLDDFPAETGSIAFSRDASMGAHAGGEGFCGPGSGFVSIWSTDDGEEIRRIEFDEIVFDVEFAPDGSWIAASQCGMLSTWNVATGEEMWRIPADSGFFNPAILQVDVSADGSLIATSSWEGNAKLFDTATGELVRVLEGHQGEVWAVEFGPDGSRVATVGHDGAAKVWDVATGETLLTLSGQAALDGLSFRVEDRLVTVGRDETIRVYTLDLDELIGIAEHRLTRGLTDAECVQYLHLESCP